MSEGNTAVEDWWVGAGLKRCPSGDGILGCLQLPVQTRFDVLRHRPARAAFKLHRWCGRRTSSATSDENGNGNVPKVDVTITRQHALRSTQNLAFCREEHCRVRRLHLLNSPLFWHTYLVQATTQYRGDGTVITTATGGSATAEGYVDGFFGGEYKYSNRW